MNNGSLLILLEHGDGGSGQPEMLRFEMGHGLQIGMKKAYGMRVSDFEGSADEFPDRGKLPSDCVLDLLAARSIAANN